MSHFNGSDPQAQADCNARIILYFFDRKQRDRSLSLILFFFSLNIFIEFRKRPISNFIYELNMTSI